MRHIKLRAILSGLLVGATLTGTAYTANAADPPIPLARSGEIILQVPPGTALSVVKQLAANAGCDDSVRPLAYSPGVYLLGLKGRKINAAPEVPTSALLTSMGKLRQTPGVTADPDYMRYFSGLQKGKTRVTAPPGVSTIPNDPFFNQQWDMTMVRMPEAWNIQFSQDPATATLVGIIDSGIESSHPDFIDSSGRAIVIDHQNFGGGVAGVDGVGHGTHVGGTVAAGTNNGDRVAGIAGWNKNGLNVRLIDASVATPGGGVSSSGIIQAFNYCISKGVKVVNISIGGYFDSSSERVAVKAAVDAGIVICASAGNGSIDHGIFPGYPADYPGVIKVTAVGPNKRLTFYSDFGFTENPQIIAAPGGGGGGGSDDVLSDWPLNGNPLFGPGINGVNSIAGTSMASPHVAGAAALLVAAGVPTDKVYQALADGAQLPNDTPSAQKYGPGVLDVYSALLPYSDPPPVATLDTAGTGSGSSGTPGSSVDRGSSYFRATPITITLFGVGRIYAAPPANPKGGLWSLESDINVEVQTISRNPSIIRVTGGRNVAGRMDRFEIPTLAPTDSKAKSFPGIQVPAPKADGSYVPLSLPPGQYKIVVNVALRDDTGGVVSKRETSQFLTILEKRLNAGRMMFAMPFKAGIIQRPPSEPNLTPEAGVLGSAAVFSLARFNPVRLPSDDDYSRFRANDPFNLKSGARFVTSDQVDGRVISYDTTTPATSIAPIGLGYWLDMDRAEAISTALLPYPSQIPGVSPIVENAVGINAYASGGGWNMIGAPFTYPVDWSVVTIKVDGIAYSIADAVRAGYISPALIGFANGDYIYSIAPSGQLEPFNGYWVRVYRDCTIIVPPVASAVATRSQQANTNSEGWRARLIANVGGDRDGQNYFGQMRGATDGEDNQDISKPPSGSGHAYVRFSNLGSEGKNRSLAFDMRALNGNSVGRQEWTAEVATDRPNAQVVLSWDGIRTAPRNTRLVLRDTVTGARVVMGSQSSYTYQSGEPGSSRKFIISLEPQASGGVLAIRNLRTVAGGRASGGLAVRFNTNAEADIVGTITTLDGRVIGSLAGTGRSQSGTETVLRWDGRNKDGGLVAAGPYKVQVKARTADGQIQVEQRVIQIVR